MGVLITQMIEHKHHNGIDLKNFPGDFHGRNQLVILLLDQHMCFITLPRQRLEGVAGRILQHGGETRGDAQHCPRGPEAPRTKGGIPSTVAFSDLLTNLGCKIEYVGQPISDAIRRGYVPMVW